MTRARWRWALGGLLAWTALLAIGLAFGEPWKAGTSGVPGLLLVTLLLVAFGLAPPVRAWLEALPRAHRVVVAGVLAAVVLGHTLGFYRATFPFVRWDMFTWVFEPDHVVFHEMVGVRRDGRQVPLNHTHIAPSLHTTFYWALESWGEHAMEDEQYAKIYTLILGAFGERYNERHPEAPLRSIATVRGTISRGEGGGLDVRRESLWVVRLDRGRGAEAP